jgi:hypothetical protein
LQDDELARLLDSTAPNDLRLLINAADACDQSVIADEALIALVLAARELQPEAIREAFQLPSCIPDAALDMTQCDAPVRIQRMINWANSVEHVRFWSLRMVPCFCTALRSLMRWHQVYKPVFRACLHP